MNRTSRLLRILIAGVAIGLGVGIGVGNPWWAALAFGVPLVVVGVLVLPHATRTSEIPPLRRGASTHSVPARIEAVTRSTLAGDLEPRVAPAVPAADRQPTLVTAMITPRDDTAYRSRWLTTTSIADARDLIGSPHIDLPPVDLPDRSELTPEFGDRPGWAAMAYPLAGLAIAATVTFAIPASVWQVSGGSSSTSFLPSWSHDDESPADIVASLDDRRDELIEQINALGPGAADRLLSVDFDVDGTTRAQVYVATSGEATSLYRSSSGEWQDPTTAPTPMRAADTFTVADISGADLPHLVDGMMTQARESDDDADFVSLEMRRSTRDAPLAWTGEFGEAPIGDVSIQARPDGTVADMFSPGDFDTTFAAARAALAEAQLDARAAVLTRFEIRGTVPATPIIFAGSIQNSGGVLMDYSAAGRSGSIVVVPGSFPEISDRVSAGPGYGDFAFDDVSQQVFESVRTQAMARGSVDAFDRDAVDIMMWNTFQDDDRLVILIQMANADAASGTYTPAGVFLEPGTR